KPEGLEVAMPKDEILDRITVDPAIFGGKPIIRGMRISVETVLGLLAHGQTIEEILDDYPDLEPEDVRACLAYAHASIANESIDAVRVKGA
ncbi:MAG TPA: DUF433 domain-containing protein, partial [Geminicoccaceae bacterium]